MEKGGLEMQQEASKYRVELIGIEKYQLGEGPYYDPRYQRFSWVDILGNKVWYIQNGEKKSIQLPQHVGAAIPLADSDGFALAMEDGIYRYENGTLKSWIDLQDVYKPYWRSNDAKADCRGRIWFGATVNVDDHEAEGNLYVYSQGKVTCQVAGTKISNGMAWSADCKKFFFSDSGEHAVFVFDFDEESGSIKNRRVLFEVTDGVPDGMTIDAEDNLWLAVWGGSRVEKRSSATGELLDTIHVPAKQTSSCCFGDEDLKTLYITSAGVGLNGEYDGCLFRCRTDVQGVAPDYSV
ncbi:MAG: SMP-30/gluconolactonase/LRE family protein [Lachnospiraceae bacterium]|jgi:sugar lactone lactonase YvrE|nr:SMP-30/gluconolactonase/LRE family protein [Lachnospiraceae bacterium]